MMDPIIHVEKVSKAFGDEEAFKNITLEFEKGKIYGLTGRNGSGKTVLFKLIIGFMTPSGGRVIVQGKMIGKGPM